MIDDASESRPLDELENEALALRAQRGSLASFDMLVQRFEGRLYNFILRRVRHTEDAEDLTQETFVRAWKHLQRYKPTYKFSTWIFTIASRVAINHMRSAHRRRTAPVEVEPTHSERPEQGLDDAEMRQTVWDVVDAELTDLQRSALWLRYAEDLSMRDIASILGKSSVGVRAILFRARTTLASHLGAGDTQSAPPVTAALRPCAVEVEI